MTGKRPTITAVVPFYNEEEDLGRTLDSWLAQVELPEAMILIDNKSSDGSLAIAQAFAAKAQGKLKVTILSEDKPGKVHALHQAQDHVTTDWAAFCDADTWYPPAYLQSIRMQIASAKANIVAVMAIDLIADRDTWPSRVQIWGKLLAATLFPGKCHTGGYAQTFRMDALRKVGGFDPQVWPFVLMDHEIVHRLHKVGTSRYHASLWCFPSQRRSDRTRVRWTVSERLLYFLMPHRFQDWFWYRFLASRFIARKLSHLNLREKTWKSTP